MFNLLVPLAGWSSIYIYVIIQLQFQIEKVKKSKKKKKDKKSKKKKRKHSKSADSDDSDDMDLDQVKKFFKTSDLRTLKPRCHIPFTQLLGKSKAPRKSAFKNVLELLPLVVCHS